jgi:hypothetical protein
MTGFWIAEVNPAGPVHEYVAPATLAVLRKTELPLHTGPLLVAVAVGTGLTVRLNVAEVAGHPPPAGMVLVIVYVPGVVAPSVITPVEELMTSPAGAAVNVPAEPPPLKDGEGFGAL